MSTAERAIQSTGGIGEENVYELIHEKLYDPECKNIVHDLCSFIQTSYDARLKKRAADCLGEIASKIRGAGDRASEHYKQLKSEAVEVLSQRIAQPRDSSDWAIADTAKESLRKIAELE